MGKKPHNSGADVHPTPPHIEQSFTKLNAYNTEKAAQVKAAKQDAEHALSAARLGKWATAAVPPGTQGYFTSTVCRLHSQVDYFREKVTFARSAWKPPRHLQAERDGSGPLANGWRSVAHVFGNEISCFRAIHYMIKN